MRTVIILLHLHSPKYIRVYYNNTFFPLKTSKHTDVNVSGIRWLRSHSCLHRLIREKCGSVLLQSRAGWSETRAQTLLTPSSGSPPAWEPKTTIARTPQAKTSTAIHPQKIKLNFLFIHRRPDGYLYPQLMEKLGQRIKLCKSIVATFQTLSVEHSGW